MKYGIVYFSIVFLTILQGKIILPDENNENWKVINTKKAWVGSKGYKGVDWCRAKGILNAPIEEVRNIIEDKKNYPNVFKRIDEIQILTDEIVYIALDMPFPFSGRDYIIKYTKLQDNNDLIYRFAAVPDSEVPIQKDYVRLLHAAGEWHLHSLNSKSTEVTYIWNGELLGDFPNWALTRAWKTQGQEVMTWLKEAVE